MGDKNVTAKFAKPQMTTEIAAPWARAVEGYISVGISHGCGSHPMPKAEVAMYRMITPGIANGNLGVLTADSMTRPPKIVKSKKDATRTIEPQSISLRLP